VGDSRVLAQRWFFYQDGASLWKWAKLDILGNILAHSGSSFHSREDCVEHARMSGYLDEPTVGRHGLGAPPTYVPNDSRAHSPQY
jgi:hypothetical protein